MGIFGNEINRNIVHEYTDGDKEFGYYFQVLLSKPKDNRVRTTTRMMETEKDAILDLPHIIPRLVNVDIKEPDNLVISDPSILHKFIYVAKIKRPERMDAEFTKIEDFERDTIFNYLNKNSIMFRIKIQGPISVATRGKVIRLALLSMKDSLSKTEFSKKCIEYTFSENRYAYDIFINGLSDGIDFARYSAYRGIPNPRKNTEAMDMFYSELRAAIREANTSIMPFGYQLRMIGEWDVGTIMLEHLKVLFGESSIIYEEPSTLKIDGQPADDEEDETDDNTDYRIADEPEEDETPVENQETEEPEEDEAREGTAEEDENPTDYRIPDDAGEDNPDEGGTDETQETEDGQEENDENQEEEEGQEADNTPTDYRIPDDAGEEGNPDEGDTEENQEEGDEPDDYRVPDDDGEDNPDETQETEEGQEEDDELQNAEDELLNDIPDEHRQIQDEELKNNYIKLYDTIRELRSRLDDVPTQSDTKLPITFIQNQLSDLKNYVFNYLSKVYSTKTYIENNINYQQYLVILSNINNLLKEINIKSKDID